MKHLHQLAHNDYRYEANYSQVERPRYRFVLRLLAKQVTRFEHPLY